MRERHTMQKDVIYSALNRLADHPNADRVFEYVHREYPSISKATVYRILKQLSENGQVLKIDVHDGADCYDHNTAPHCHAICSGCHRVFDVPYTPPPLSELVDSQGGDFDVTDYSLLFIGSCRDCRENFAKDVMNHG